MELLKKIIVEFEKPQRDGGGFVATLRPGTVLALNSAPTDGHFGLKQVPLMAMETIGTIVDGFCHNNVTTVQVRCCSDLRYDEEARPRQGGHRRRQGHTGCACFRLRIVRDGCDSRDRETRKETSEKQFVDGCVVSARLRREKFCS